MNSVAVTGLGLATAHGDDPQAVFAALMRGESALRPVFADLPKPTVAATVAFDESRWFTKLQLAGVDRVSQLAVAAADLAMKDAKASGAVEPERIGVYVGCGMGGAASLELAYRNGSRVPPLTVPAFMPNAPAAHVAMRQRAQGPVLTYSVACASAAVAIAEAAKAVQCGEVDLAIAGGSEALIVPGVVLAWQALQTLATFQPGEAAHSVRPFSTDRTGFALGEGAAFLVLESAAHARRRGARTYAHLTGWGLSCDATHLTKPDVMGQARALRAALRRADLQPRDVDYCNAHGTATRIGDVIERDALAEVWGSHLDRLHVSSTKALHGHLLGAAGSLEAAITVLALCQRQMPPNAHCTEMDPACRLNLVTQAGTAAPELKAAISNSFAFGGTNAVLLFERA
ncbi:MAG TPA: beta-ketoacyl-[acyl-carrier-protein] synthase family protein [Rhizobacter sp.]|nr:beta-ketoacyl-[acyl-carrier-protein] synthase family protein [Rhizobacter sp.]